MQTIKFQLNRKSLQIIFFLFIRSLLEYADVVWDNCMQYEATQLEKKSNMKLHVLSVVPLSLFQ